MQVFKVVFGELRIGEMYSDNNLLPMCGFMMEILFVGRRAGTCVDLDRRCACYAVGDLPVTGSNFGR